MREDRSYTKGQIIRLSGGEYDDYAVYAVVKVLKPFSEHAVIQEFKSDDVWPQPVELMTWLIENKYVRVMDVPEFLLGRYYVGDYR